MAALRAGRRLPLRLTAVGAILLSATMALATQPPVSHALAADFDEQASCATAAHPGTALSFRGFCDDDGECYPPLYLLGMQKAATSSIAEVLMRCGLVSFGLPDGKTGKIGSCAIPGVPCKESLHDVALETAEGRTKFRHLFDLGRCDKIMDKDFQASIAPCRAAQFLEATPLQANDLGTLLANVPMQYVAPARFAVILREPVARMLSWYNHVVVGQEYWTSPQLTRAEWSSFAAFFDAAVRHGIGAWQLGNYSSWIDSFVSKAPRSQLLVLAFEAVVADPRDALHRLTTHYGLPRVLTGMGRLPDENSHDGPAKVVEITCATRAKAAAAHAPLNALLYARLQHDRATAAAPPVEPPFPAFDVTKSVPCGGSAERTMGDGDGWFRER